MKNETSRNRYSQNGHARGLSGIKSLAPQGIIPCTVSGILISVAVILLLSIIVSAIIYQTDDPAIYVAPAAYSVLYVSALMGGFMAARFNKKSALLCGLIVGCGLILLTFIISLTIPKELSTDYGIIENISLRLAIIVCSIIGAFIGVSDRSTVKKRKNHKKR